MPNETIGGLLRLLRSPRSGTFVMNGTTPVVVANRFVTPNSIVNTTLKTVGGTVGSRKITTITPGTGFTIVGEASDTSTINYLVIG